MVANVVHAMVAYQHKQGILVLLGRAQKLIYPLDDGVHFPALRLHEPRVGPGFMAYVVQSEIVQDKAVPICIVGQFVIQVASHVVVHVPEIAYKETICAVGAAKKVAREQFEPSVVAKKVNDLALGLELIQPRVARRQAARQVLVIGDIQDCIQKIRSSAGSYALQTRQRDGWRVQKAGERKRMAIADQQVDVGEFSGVGKQQIRSQSVHHHQDDLVEFRTGVVKRRAAVERAVARQNRLGREEAAEEHRIPQKVGKQKQQQRNPRVQSHELSGFW